MTHEFLAQLIGVRRQTVTVIVGVLQAAGFISSRRGMVRIVNRPGLEAACCECYRVSQGLYEQIVQVRTIVKRADHAARRIGHREKLTIYRQRAYNNKSCRLDNPVTFEISMKKKPTPSDRPTKTGTGDETHQTARDAASTLTTNQGVPIADNQNSLKSAARGPTLLEDFVLREKITHFDHERIPERIVHARGSGAWIFPMLPVVRGAHESVVSTRSEKEDAGLCQVFDRCRGRRFGRYASRRSRLRGQVLYRRRQFRSRWQ